jgi:hypothetical protein
MRRRERRAVSAAIPDPGTVAAAHPIPVGDSGAHASPDAVVPEMSRVASFMPESVSQATALVGVTLWPRVTQSLSARQVAEDILGREFVAAKESELSDLSAR